MAVVNSLSTPFLIKSSSTAKTTIRLPPHRLLVIENKLKVYEDESTGVVCYRDENGEITCEGYDEGPRFCHQLPKSPSKSRDEEIVELLQRNWFHIADAAAE
ncbi:hypothetical protein HAX54_013859 [Datura stramonium]|uniref:Uncharacterized protein n=1 Tax=Datura stramonium TaxID=4076 RepID=A0ABS8TM11_DATST|nr:hypothetical protein [Datura stramonium]